MNKRSCWFICIIVVIALCSFNPPVGRADEPSITHEVKKDLIGRANPALKGINSVVFDFKPVVADSNIVVDVWETLHKDITKQLSGAGISCVLLRDGIVLPVDTPVFTLAINALRPADSKQYVFCVQTSLASGVCLKDDSSVCLKAELWKMASDMQAASAKDISNAITTEAVMQTEVFVLAHSAANQAKPSADKPTTNLPALAIGRKISRQTKPIPSEYRYVASKNSKVFHRPQCPSAGRISPENLVGFTSRADAVKSGRRPCKRCKP
jgi:hypothetical protein